MLPMKPRPDEIAMYGFLVILFGGSGLWFLRDASSATTADSFWTRFFVGIFLLALAFLPVFYLRKDVAMKHPPSTAERIREFRRTNLVLLGLFAIVIVLTFVGLAINILAGAPIAADVALGLFLVFAFGWSFLVVRVISRLPPA